MEAGRGQVVWGLGYFLVSSKISIQSVMYHGRAGRVCCASPAKIKREQNKQRIMQFTTRQPRVSVEVSVRWLEKTLAEKRVPDNTRIQFACARS